MTGFRTLFTSISAIAFGMLAAIPARAASLVQVSNWTGGASLPSDVTMWIYVPNAVATNPPILTLIHYCGGTASTVFGQAQGGGVVPAADKYGFIIVAPSSGRCWDVESNKTFTRDGGGDSHAIAQMVRYAISNYHGNADRVYSTGDSSGAMMTELLLALYPDIFKGGSAFAGIPAGCRGTNETGTTYSGQCAGGNVTHTPAEWGTIVQNMDPGYTGHRPRVQLFHGSADTTISYTNFTEAIKEWSDVLGLSTTPTTTVTGLTLGTHQATRQEWTNSCGFLVLDAFESIGGDHGPSDCLFDATYVVPFLGLDQTGAVDPEIAQCGSGGASGGRAVRRAWAGLPALAVREPVVPAARAALGQRRAAEAVVWAGAVEWAVEISRPAEGQAPVVHSRPAAVHPRAARQRPAVQWLPEEASRRAAMCPRVAVLD